MNVLLTIASLLLFALTLFAAYGGRFNTEYFTIPAVITLLLPWLAIATLIVAAAWLCCGHFIKGGIGLLAIIASWEPVSTVCPLSWPGKQSDDGKKFTVMTYNMVHGWDMENESGGLGRNRTIDYIINCNADIVCLQEAGTLSEADVPLFSKEQQADMRKAYPYRAGNNTSDTKVISKYPVEMISASQYLEGTFDKRPYTFYKVKIAGEELTLVNVHLMSFLLSKDERDVLTEIKSVRGAKNSYHEMKGDIRYKLSNGFRERATEAKLLREALNKIKGPLIVCGDFNDVPESYVYRIIRGDDMRDAYVETGFGPLVTYNQHAFWFHLDQILYRGPLLALDVEKGKTRLSDHYPLTATFELTEAGH